MAVGGSGSNVDEPFAAMSTNAGSSWTAVSPAGLSASNDLTDVSCTGSTFCLAVGENYSTDRAFTEAWNGHTWASPAAQPVNPSSTYDYLNFVDCTSPTVCTAVGDESNGHDGQTLVEALKSGTWTVASTADPGGPGNDNFLHAVSCTTSSCIAVGEYYDGTAWEPLGLSQGANSWSALDGQGAAVSVLAGVSCVAETTFCMAAGNHTTGDAVIDSALTEVRSGSTWQVSGAANVPGSQYTQLTGVSCPTSTQCVTVGTYYSSKAERNETLADLYSSGSWTVAFPANLGTESDNLTQVSCWSTADCSAVGNYDDAGVEKTLAEYTTNGGRTWMVATDSNPGGASVLSDVSCTSTACVAVGAYQNGSTELALVERSTNGGRTWQQVTIPGVSGASSVALEGVSCLGGSTGTCIAVGYSVVGAVERALAEHSGNEGATWAVGSVPASGAASALFSVSCWAQFDCVAVGGQLSSSATGGIGVISPRSVVAAPRVGELTPGNVALPGSEGLSAFASAASSQVLAVASSNGGATWTVNTTPDASSMANDLGSVACPSATQCVGVGLSTQSDLVEQTLIETRS
jgi:hypothetical protein